MKLKRKVLAKTAHKPAIDDEDVKRLFESGVFDTNKPTSLQNKVFFGVMLFFCRRGRQNLRQLKKNDFEVKLDAKGESFVIKTMDEFNKNQRENDEQEDGAMMMSNDGPLCLVASFRKYTFRLNPENE